jgi:hypothetical protein
MSIGTSDADGGVVAHNLSRQHGQGLALGGVDLARHNATARLVLRQSQLTKTATRSGAKESNIIGNLHEGDGDDVECTMRFYKGVVCCQGFELAKVEVSVANAKSLPFSIYLVGGSDEGKAGQVGNLSSNLGVPSLLGVEALCSQIPLDAALRFRSVTHGSNRGPTLSEHAEAREDSLDAFNAVRNLLNVATELLTKSQGGGILQVGSSNLHNAVELLGLGLESYAELLQGGNQVVMNFGNGSNVHDSREAAHA